MTRNATSGSFPASPFPEVLKVFGELRFHTNGDVLALAFDAQGVLYSIEEPGLLRHWNVRTGRSLQAMQLSDLETLWQFSSDARVVASASDEVSLWEVATGQLVASLPQPSWVAALALRANPVLVATGHDDGVVRLWNAAGMRLLRELGGHDRPISALAFSPDGSRLASAAEDRMICLWEVDSGRELGKLARHTDHIQQLAWHPDGRVLVSAAWDRTARVWDTTTFEPVILLNSHADRVTAMTFNPDGKVLACADSDKTIRLWDPLQGMELRVLEDRGEEIRALAFSADGKVLASSGTDPVIRLWDPQQGRLLSPHDSSALSRHGLAVMAGGSRLVSTGAGGGLRVWETATGKQVFEQTTAPVAEVLASSRDGRWLATGAQDNRVQIWDASTLKPGRVLEGQAGQVAALAFAPNALTLASASASDATVWLWNIQTNEPALIIPVAADGCSVETLAFHPSGGILATGGIDYMSTGGSDGAICVWDASKRERICVFNRGTTSIAFHPTGRWLASAGLDQTVRVWDVEKQQLAFEAAGHADAVTCVAYHPEGLWLVSASEDRTVRIWNASTGEACAVHELDVPVKALAFSPDGRFLYSGNGNTTCYQLDVSLLLADDLPVGRP
jgi:WD40 repeat protein